jgi:hypothetical protein
MATAYKEEVDGLSVIIKNEEILDRPEQELDIIDITEQELDIIDITEQERDIIDITEQERDIIDISEQEQDVVDITELDQDVIDITEQYYEENRHLTAELDNLLLQLQQNMDEWQRICNRIHILLSTLGL